VSMLSPQEFAARARWLVQAEHLERFRRVKRIWQNLTVILRGVSPPIQAEIEADEYDGSVPISQWLARESRKRDGCNSARQSRGGRSPLASRDASLQV